MELFSAFGIDIKILIAQLVNFAVLGFILYKIGYKPILKFVRERTETIEKGVKNAEAAKDALARAKSEHLRIIRDGREEAQQLLERAQQNASRQGDEIVARSQQEAGKLLVKARDDIKREHEKMLLEAKSELASVVVLATEKLLRTKVDADADRKLIEMALKETEQSQ